ncbi:hypothetical protein CLI92_06230 [Vandammella animalimorsus]|uniref:BrnT family toxin n=1 Tax=Vandammella animalimorsus TaxID=2029117 RepID=A0A2A2T6B7_9BURK|nr:BrnT family toxin [Vandammella animalimorsus]PAT32120.1 hypothetical protein CK626_06780 [Vandammella animalimorsus]PAX17139.1 hypothetical protein CLI92_06230 [Vandammella animalimorsus]PAX19112.1 hypothetical protein CLI93_10160 [Vandammella animalimorsus]
MKNHSARRCPSWAYRHTPCNVRLDRCGFSFLRDSCNGANRPQDYGEDRWATIGLFWSALLYVVYTVRDDGKTIRLISARKANGKEAKQYREANP